MIDWHTGPSVLSRSERPLRSIVFYPGLNVGHVFSRASMMVCAILLASGHMAYFNATFAVAMAALVVRDHAGPKVRVRVPGVRGLPPFSPPCPCQAALKSLVFSDACSAVWAGPPAERRSQLHGEFGEVVHGYLRFAPPFNSVRLVGWQHRLITRWKFFVSVAITKLS
jgi:hypothetical protein